LCLFYSVDCRYFLSFVDVFGDALAGSGVEHVTLVQPCALPIFYSLQL